jgi:hypothetical protein
MRKIVHHARTILLMVGVVALASLLACTTTTPAGSIQVERVFPDLSFQEMTNLVQPGTSGLIFVTEQKGVIFAFSANN